MPLTPDDERARFERWADTLTRVLIPMARRSEREAVIAKAEAILSAEPDPAFRQVVLGGVSSLLQVHGWTEDSLAWSERMVAEAPDSPQAQNHLAIRLLCNPQHDPTPDELEQALAHSAEAVAKARASGTWLRSVLYDRCRIAMAAKRYDHVAEAMAEILDAWATPSDLDTPWLEGEWLSALPTGAVDAELVRRYRSAAEEHSQHPFDPRR